MEISEDVEARPIFIITVCQGAVRGYQMMLPAFASVCLADPEATFGMPEVRLGAMPAVQTVLLRRRLTEDNIRRLMMSTDPIDAYEAQRVGLVDFVGDVEMELARLIQKNCQPKTMVQFYKPDLERAWAEAEEHRYERLCHQMCVCSVRWDGLRETPKCCWLLIDSVHRRLMRNLADSERRWNERRPPRCACAILECRILSHMKVASARSGLNCSK
eukprot:652130-Amphidinium_carterae.1